MNVGEHNLSHMETEVAENTDGDIVDMDEEMQKKLEEEQDVILEKKEDKPAETPEDVKTDSDK